MVAFLRKRQYGRLARALINHKTGILCTHQSSLLELTISRLQREGIRRKVNNFKFNNGILLCAFLYLPFKSTLSHDICKLTVCISCRGCTVNIFYLISFALFLNGS